jgi:2',3'-cyclic-nucleotide 2'-phosphodiesterase (5'-nucleotidase family)
LPRSLTGSSGNFVPVTSGLYPCELSNIDNVACSGGQWNKARIIAQRRELDPNVILVDNGDNIWGSLFTQTDHGALFWEVFDLMNYSAFVLGPRDTDYSTLLPLSPSIQDANFPTVISNSIIANNSGLAGTVYSVTVDVGGNQTKTVQKSCRWSLTCCVGEQIGIIGITGESSPRITNAWPGGAEIYSPVTACQRYVDAFTDAGTHLLPFNSHEFLFFFK